MSVLDMTEGRYDRQQLITWWDQSRLQRSRVLVVGAGALGNEIAKNLALLGIGTIELIDMDTVERTNLARCVLFRENDERRPKAEVAAEAVAHLNPDVIATARVGNVLDLPLGRLADFDLVIGGLDNREARAWVNQACRKLGLTWIDGAIEGLRGIVRVFPPDGACYECTLGEVDREILARRKSCALLSIEEMLSGKVPTTSTTASVIAALQVQEAVKILVGRADLVTLNNRAFVFVGETMETYHVEYGEDPDCLAHDRYPQLLPWTPPDVAPLSELVAAAEGGSGAVDALDLEHDLVLSSHCAPCGEERQVRRRLTALPRGAGLCPECGGDLQLQIRGSLAPDDALLKEPLDALDIRRHDVLTVRSGSHRTHYRVETR